MSIIEFKDWLVNVFGINSAELSQKRSWKQFVDQDSAWSCLQFIGQFPGTTNFYNWVADKVGIDCWDNGRANWRK